MSALAPSWGWRARFSMHPRKLSLILGLTMALALFMGCGPGIYLINPDAASPGATRFILGMPLVWVWTSFWCIIEGVCVTIAYRCLWRSTEA